MISCLRAAAAIFISPGFGVVRRAARGLETLSVRAAAGFEGLWGARQACRLGPLQHDDLLEAMGCCFGARLLEVFFVALSLLVRGPAPVQPGLSNLICDLLGFFFVRHGVKKPWHACAFSAERLGAGVCGAGGSRVTGGWRC